MKRVLVKQFFNEWRDNIWLIVELLIVFLTIWYIVSYVFVQTVGLKDPNGLSPENIFNISVKKISQDSPIYFTPEDGSETYVSDLAQLVNRLKDNQYVEYVAIHDNGLPYNMNYYGSGVFPLDYKDSIMYYVNRRSGSPEIVEVLKLQPIDGSDRTSLVEAMKRGELLLTNNKGYEKQGRDPLALKGKRVILGNDSVNAYVVGGLVYGLKRNDYEINWGGDGFFKMEPGVNYASNIAVRVKSGMGKKFEETFKSDITLRRAGNIYLTDLSRIEDMRESSRRTTDMEIRLLIVCVFFLIVTILLGLLGTFWFRIQQRSGEIAIRKVCGATKWQVFRRLFSEGFLILGISTILATLIVWPFFSKVTTFLSVEKPDMIKAELVTLAICAFGVLVSIYGPALKVMKIEPAIAIKDE